MKFLYKKRLNKEFYYEIFLNSAKYKYYDIYIQIKDIKGRTFFKGILFNAINKQNLSDIYNFSCMRITNVYSLDSSQVLTFKENYRYISLKKQRNYEIYKTKLEDVVFEDIDLQDSFIYEFLFHLLDNYYPDKKYPTVLLLDVRDSPRFRNWEPMSLRIYQQKRKPTINDKIYVISKRNKQEQLLTITELNKKTILGKEIYFIFVKFAENTK